MPRKWRLRDWWNRKPKPDDGPRPYEPDHEPDDPPKPPEPAKKRRLRDWLERARKKWGERLDKRIDLSGNRKWMFAGIAVCLVLAIVAMGLWKVLF